MLKNEPKMPEGPVTRQFIYRLIERAVSVLGSLKGGYDEQVVVNDFREEVQDRIDTGGFKESEE